ncbi:hypothetical protein [Lysobacter sp. CA199]|uniref:hypothetical protein n=1 Tax=Lysobacter sp. CA199 TaxID=3455608 RepID=UPI003F8D6356
MSQSSEERGYAVLSPFKFRGVIVKPGGDPIHPDAEECRELQQLGLIASDLAMMPDAASAAHSALSTFGVNEPVPTAVEMAFALAQTMSPEQLLFHRNQVDELLGQFEPAPVRYDIVYGETDPETTQATDQLLKALAAPIDAGAEQTEPAVAPPAVVPSEQKKSGRSGKGK